MSLDSKIEWTDATWNPVRGCTKISPGCKHCYAETFAERFRGVPGHPYQQGFDLRLIPEKLPDPLRWRSPKMIFVNSMSDLFHDQVPDDYIEAVADSHGESKLAHLPSAHQSALARMAELLKGQAAFRCKDRATFGGGKRRESQVRASPCTPSA